MSTPDWRALLGLQTEDEMRQQVIDELTDPVGTLTNLNPTAPTMVWSGMLIRLIKRGINTVVETAAASLFRKYARGGWLDLHAQDMRTDRIAAVATEGAVTLTLTGAGPQTLQAGHIVTTPSGAPQFRLLAGVTLTDATPTAVAARCTEDGTVGNVALGTLTVLSPPVTGVEVSNGTDWITTEGVDEEKDDELAVRLDTRWDQLAQSATEDTYRSWALDAGAQDAMIVVHPRGQGTLDVVIVGPSGIPSSALIADVQAHIDARRPLSASPLVRAYDTQGVSLAITVVMHPTQGDEATVQAAAEALLDDMVTPTWVGDAATSPALVPFALGEDYRPLRVSSALATLEHVLEVSGLPAQVSVAADEYVAWSSRVVTVTRAGEV